MTDDPTRLLVIIPSRGRPASVADVVRAWEETSAYDVADLLWAVDNDDPTVPQYLDQADSDKAVMSVFMTGWQPMVRKLNTVAGYQAYFRHAIGFAGDDHRPRTDRWAHRYLDALTAMGTGIVYGNDLLRGSELPTQWAMTTDIIQALGGQMVPGGVDHLYCDNIILTLGQRADCIAYLDDVVVEHLHPTVGTAAWDDGYLTVNSPGQYDRDEQAFVRWRTDHADRDAAAVRALRETP